jgi:hypothetical protein
VQQLENKKALMEGQLDALENSEFNKTVLSTLQTSAMAMKKMGLHSDLSKTDQIISDLEEGINAAHDINSTVSTSLGQFDLNVDDSLLDEELNMILGLDNEVPPIILPPVAINEINKPVEVQPVVLPTVPIAGSEANTTVLQAV